MSETTEAETRERMLKHLTLFRRDGPPLSQVVPQSLTPTPNQSLKRELHQARVQLVAVTAERDKLLSDVEILKALLRGIHS